MKNALIALTVSAAIVAGGLSLHAADAPASKPKAAASCPASAPTSAPTSAPSQGKLLATVGGTKIYSDRIDMILSKAPKDTPPDRLAMARKQILSQMIAQELTKALVASKKVECTDLELAAETKKVQAEAATRNITPAQLASLGVTDEAIRDQVRMRKLVQQTTEKSKVAALLKVHPDYFNGTKVKASHILIPCDALASQADHKAAIAKVEKLAADIKAGKISFEDGAKANSSCPSKEKGGDLGEFTFDRMVPPFALTAFGLKVGQTSGVVHTEYGYHLIKVTGREEGKAALGPEAEQAAVNCLLYELQTEMLNLATTTIPIVYVQ